MLKESTLIKRAIKSLNSKYLIKIRSLEELNSYTLELKKRIDDAENQILELDELINRNEKNIQKIGYELKVLLDLKGFLINGGSSIDFFHNLRVVPNEKIEKLSDVDRLSGVRKKNLSISRDNIPTLKSLKLNVQELLHDLTIHLSEIEDIPRLMKVESYKYSNKGRNVQIF